MKLKNPILSAVLGAMWVGCLIASLGWHIEGRPWFGGLKDFVLVSTVVICAADYFLSRDAWEAERRERAKRHAGPDLLATSAGRLVFLFASLILCAAGVYNIAIGNVPGGGLLIAFAALFAGGLYSAGRRRP